MTHHSTTPTLAYRDPSLPVDERVADLLARMTIDEKLAQLGSAWVFQLAEPTRLRRGAGDAAARRRHRPRHPRSAVPAASRRAEAADARQRDPAPPGRAHPPRHPRHRPRGDLRRADGPRGHRVPAGDRRGGDVPARAQPDDRRRHPPPDAGDRRPSRPVARARRLPRSALGPAARRRTARIPYLVAADGHRLHPRPAGRRPRATASSPPPSTSSGTAPRRAASTGRRPTCPSASCATSTCARSRRRCATPALASVMNGYHELDGVPVRRQPLAADRAAARRVGLRRHRGVGLLLGPPARRLPPRRRRRRGGRCGGALHAGIDVELPGTDCYDGPLRDALASGSRSTIADVDEAVRRVLDDEVPPRSVRAAVRRRRPGRACTRARRRRLDLARQIARRQPGAAEERRRPPARVTAASIAVIGPNAASRAQPARRLQLHLPRRVAARGVAERAQRVRDADRARRRRRRPDRPRPRRRPCVDALRHGCPPTRQSPTSRDARSPATIARVSTTPSRPRHGATSPSW